MFKRSCLGAALILALACPPGLHAQSDVRYAVQLQAQDLGTALKLLAQQMKIQIVYPAELVQGKRAPTVVGSLSAMEALDELLRDSGLRYEFLDGQTVTLSPGGTSVVNPFRIQGAHPDSTGAGVTALDAVLVTGSRLRRLGGEGSSPVSTIDAAAIRRSGSATVRDVLKMVPQAAVNPSEISGFMASAPIQLRGLSVGTTLVLVNGHRVAPSGANGVTVDVGAIPLAAVERMEIVTDGGSAIYGSDAIGGIVNVILKERLEGAQLDLRYGAADDGKAAERQASFTWGYRGARFSTSFALDVLEREPLLYGDREPTNDMDFRRLGGTDFRSPYTHRGTVYSLDGSPLPGLQSGFAMMPQEASGTLRPEDFLPVQGQESRDSGYYARRQIQPETRRIGFLSNTALDLGEDITAKLEVLASDNRGDFVLVQPFVHAGISVPATNPYNPFGVEVGVNRLLTGMAPNVLHNRDRFHSVVAGLHGLFGDSWEWNVALLSSRDLQKTRETNALDFAAITAALDNPDPASTLNLFVAGPVASDSVLAGLLPTLQRRYEAKEHGVEAGASGNLFRLPAGQVQAFVGFEARSSRLHQVSQFDNSAADRDVHSLYAELLVPVVESANITAALRRDRYSDFGSTTNPKFGLEWRIAGDLRFRGSYGTSFKAPNLFDLGGVPFVVPSILVDPARGGETTTIELLAGGNPDLRPEEARTYNFGFGYGFDLAWRHLRVDVSADLWRVNQSVRIVTPNPQALVDHEASFADRIERASPTAADLAAGYPGKILTVDTTSINFGRTLVQGLDLRARLQAEAFGGLLNVDGEAVYVDKYEAELNPGLLEDRRGHHSMEGFAPEWKAILSGQYQRGAWQLGLSSRYIGSYRYQTTDAVSASTLFDAVASYAFGEAAWTPLAGASLSVGAMNLFNRAPPFMNFLYGYDALQYDNVGRFVYARISKRF